MKKLLKSMGSLLLAVSMLTSFVITPTWAAGSGGGEPYKVTYELENVTRDEGASEEVGEGEQYDTMLRPIPGYTLDKADVIVTMGDKPLEKTLTEGEEEDYTFNPENGELVIREGVITGNVKIKATATPVTTKQYTVTYNLTHVGTTGTNGEEISEGVAYPTTLTPDTGYTLTELSVTVGDTKLAEGEGYTFDPKTGELVIRDGVITGNVVITATATPVATKQYIVTYNLTHVGTTGTNGEEISEGVAYPTTLTPDTGYTLTELSVTVGDTKLAEGEGYTFDPKTGELVIRDGVITGKVVITATAKKIEIDIHSENITDLKKDGDKAVSYKLGHSTVTGDPAKVVTITADNGYITPNALAPAGTGVTFAGGLDKDNNFVNTVAADGQYKSLIYTVGEADGGITAADLQSFVRGMTCVWDGKKSQTITVGADLEKPSIPYGKEGKKIELTYFNGSYYGYVPAEDQEKGITWFDAYNQAKSYTYQDAKGYLLTIESEDEHNLVRGMQDGKIGWAGGTRMVKAEDANKNPDTSAEIFSNEATDYADTTTYGNWYWACGPNAGTKFFNGATAATGSAVDGQYNNWTGNEPNNSGSKEGYLEYGHGEGGKWNDFNAENSAVKGFYIEFTPVSETRDASDTRTTNIYDLSYTLENVSVTAEDTNGVIKDNTLVFGGKWDRLTDPVTNDMQEGYTTTLAPKDGYTFKEVSVTVGETKLTEGAGYTFDPETGNLVITKGNITGDVVIRAVATPEEFKVTYDWGKDAPSDATLPTDSKKYYLHDPVTVDPTYRNKSTSTAPKNGVPGRWIFSGWTADSDLTDGITKDVIYKGTWTFTATTYTVKYDWGKDAPSDAKLPTDSKKYNPHDPVTVDTTYKNKSTSTAPKNGVPGRWIFSGWTADSDLTDGITKDVIYKGTWTFTATTYTVKYDWGKDAPSDAKLPTDSKKYNLHDPVTVDTTYRNKSTSTAPKNGVPGKWTFSGWTAKPPVDPAVGIESNVDYTGEWEFEPDTYKATYNWGTDVPSGVTLPADQTYNWHDPEKLDETYKNGTVVYAPKNDVPGKWTFGGWTAKPPVDPAVGIESNVDYTGEWEFTPTYVVTYDWGTDAPSDATLPTDSKKYELHNPVIVDPTYTSASTSTAPRNSVKGTWKFSGWTTGADLIDGITQNVEYKGTWTFTATSTGGGGGGGGGSTTTPKTYKVEYNANGGTGTLTDSKSPYASGATVTVLGKGEIARKDYEFIVWNTKADGTGTSYSGGDTFTITADVTLYAQWEKDESPFIQTPHYAYIVGYKDGTVRPGGDITRAEVVTVFFRLLKDEVRAENWSKQNSYNDIKNTAWYNNAVSTMTKMKVIDGYTDGTFQPDASITRAEAAAIISRFKVTGAATSATTFNDISDHWAETEIKQAAALGWFEGDGSGTFRPNDAITRAEFVTMVNRVLKRVPENNEDMLSSMNVWPDNGTSAWYYKAMQEATNSHDYDYKTSMVPGLAFNYEKWTNLVTNRNWLVLEKPSSEPTDI